jgi:hypothetical protein
MESNLKTEIKSINKLEDLQAFRSRYKDSYCLNARRHYYYDMFCYFLSRRTELPPTRIKEVFMQSIDEREIELRKIHELRL